MLAGCGESASSSFSVNGRVMCGNNPVSNAVVSTDLGETVTTDESGAFSFPNLSSATILSVSAEGYVIKENVLVNKATDNLVISAEAMYTLTGRVESNGVGIAGARVKVSGLVQLETMTDSFGNFTANNIAGESRVSVEKDGMIFESKIATIDNNYLVFSGTTDVTAVVKDENGEILNEAVLTINGAEMDYSNGAYIAGSVALGSVVVPSLEGYHFEPSQVVLSRENESIEFTAYKLYSVTGVTQSGGSRVSGVSILVNGQAVTTSNELGEFTLSGLWAQNNITFSHPTFRFNGLTVNSAQEINVDGTFTLSGVVISGGSPLADVYVESAGNSTFTDANGEFKINGVALNSEIYFEKDGFETKTMTVTNTNSLIITTNEYYNANISVTSDGEALAGVTLMIGDTPYTSDEYGNILISNLTGEYYATLSLDGYTSTSITITKQNSAQNVVLNKIFDVEITVHSGDIVLSNATVKYGSVTTTTDESGKLTISAMTQPTEIKVSVDGYNAKSLTANKNNTVLDFDLSYTVSGSVTNGTLNVNGVVKTTDDTYSADIVNGTYTIDLKGSKQLIAVANGLDFEENSVLQASVIDFSATYSISGTLTSEDILVENAEVSLVGVDGTVTYTTKTDGKFAFENLAGEYRLLVTDNRGVTLRPSYYTITNGGEYDFNANGYAIAGQVLNGGVGVEGVTVYAGNSSTTTDSSGNFRFDLIIGEVSVSAFKTGYTFDEAIVVDDENLNIIINSTYMVEGTVLSGNAPVSDVVVTVGEYSTKTDENGHYEISGLTGAVTIEFYKDGYTFSNIETSGYYGENVYTTFSISGSVSVGDSALDGATVSNGKVSVVTGADGAFTLSGISSGDVITVSKDGFAFNSITANAYGQDFVFNGTFSVSGSVSSSGRVISGVTVTYGEFTTITDGAGRFSLSGLNFYGTMTFTLSGYTFSPVEITGPVSNLEVVATFAVSGKITIGGVGLGGVIVSSGTVSTTTNENGEYTLNGLSTSGRLNVEKYGYDFEGNTRFTGATTLDFTATYWVTVKVSSGSVDLSGVVITANAGKVEENSANTFTIRGLTGTNTITADVNGYNTGSVTVTDHAVDIEITMTYDVVLRISGAKLNDITVNYTDENGEYSKTFSDVQVVLNNLVGVGQWNISRDGYRFTPNTDTYSIPKTVDISYQAVYTISGRVTTSAGIGVCGMTISFSDVSTTTDTSGNYTLTGLIGDGTLYATFSAENCDGITRSTYVASEGTYNFTVADNEYAWWLYQNGYQRIRSADGYYNETKGSVVSNAPIVGEIVQTVYSTKKKDNTGQYLVISNNYGTKMQDTRISVVGYYTNDSQSVDYKQVTKDSVNAPDASGVVTANYSGVGWNTTTPDGYKQIYGSEPTGLSIYNLTSVYFGTTISQSGDNLVFTITINNPTDAVVNNYKTQMSAMSGTSPENITFSKIEITYTFDIESNLVSVRTVDTYTVKAFGINASTVSTLTETFTINDGTDLINKDNYN